MMKLEDQNDPGIKMNICPLSKARVIIFGLGMQKELKSLLQYRPNLMLNIADKPVIIHFIEHFAREGIETFDLVLHHFPEQIEERLDNGSRWGVNINYHLIKDPKKPFSSIIPSVRNWESGRILIGLGDTLPNLSKKLEEDGKAPIFYNYPDGEWSGWAMLNSEEFKTLPSTVRYENIPSNFKTAISKQVKPLIYARNYYELKESNIRFINEEDSTFIFPTQTKKVEPGVWISRAVIIEPGVEVVPPILIGENTHIRSGARIGPNVIIENHCIIDNNSSIENSLICQNSYVGETLEISNCIVDRNTLINLSLGTELNIQEDFLISESSPPKLQRVFQKIAESIFAAILLFLLLPLYMVMRAVFNMEKQSKVLLPAEDNPDQWITFDQYTFRGKTSKAKEMLLACFGWLPSLWNIIKGELSFIGTPPRSVNETKSLPAEWQSLYLKTKPGLISHCDLNHASRPTEDELYASEACYAAQMSAAFDIKLFFLWAANKIRGRKHAS